MVKCRVRFETRPIARNGNKEEGKILKGHSIGKEESTI
jgi:hypothetical protein